MTGERDTANLSIGDHRCGGYYVARPGRRNPHMSAELLPETILSASGCICEFLPGSWTIKWSSDTMEQRLKGAAEFGIPPERLDDVMTWATDAFSKEFGWPDSFYTLPAARDARARFVPETHDVVIFGLGLHETDAGAFIEAAKPPPQKPGCAQQGPTGVFECIRSGERLVEGGDIAGFELLATYFGGLTCSWLCNGLERDCAGKLGVIPNNRGLIASYEDAKLCAEYSSQPEVGAEPGLWQPWLVVVYD